MKKSKQNQYLGCYFSIHRLSSLSILTLIIFIVPACGGGGGGGGDSTTQEVNKTTYTLQESNINIEVLDIPDENEIIVASGDNGDKMAIFQDDSNEVNEIIIETPEGSIGTIKMGDEGYPSFFKSEGYVMEFSNYTGSTAVATVTDPDGKVDTIEIPFDTSVLQNARVSNIVAENEFKPGGILRFSAAATEFILCGVSLYGAATTVVALAPVLSVCGSYMLGVVAYVTDSELLTGASIATGLLTCSVGEISACVTTATTLTGYAVDAVKEVITNQTACYRTTNLMITDYHPLSDVTNSGTGTYTISSNGKLLAFKTESDENDNGTIDNIHYFTEYNYSNGRLLTNKEEIDSDNDGTIDSTVINNFIRNSAGTVTQIREDNDWDNDGTIDSVITHTRIYDSKGNGLSSKIEIDEDNDGTVDSIYTSTFTYDGNGIFLTNIREYDSDNDGTVDSITKYTNTYTYDNNGNKSMQRVERDPDNDGTIDRISTITYTYGLYDC